MVIWVVFNLSLRTQNVVMTNIVHRSCCLWVTTSIGQIPRSGITGLKDIDACNFVHYLTIIYPNPLLSIEKMMLLIVRSPTLTWFLTEWKESIQERSGLRNSRRLLAINMSFCPIKDASGSSWYPGHIAFVKGMVWKSRSYGLDYFWCWKTLQKREFSRSFSKSMGAYASFKWILSCSSQTSPWALPQLPRGMTPVVYTVVATNGACAAWAAVHNSPGTLQQHCKV